MKPILLDLFSGAGGCAKGYQRAGFYVIGIDFKAQPRYPGEEFYVADAIATLDGLLNGGFKVDHWRWGEKDRVIKLGEIAAIHASPPCQAYSILRKTNQRSYPDLIGPVRDHLKQTGKPYVIENVPGAPLVAATVLCGSMFGLGVNGRQLRRHRLFESNVFIKRPDCNHTSESIGVYGHGGAVPRYTYDEKQKKRYYQRRGGYQGTYAEQPVAMDIEWMRHPELTQAIPPSYTEHVGKYLMYAIRERMASDGRIGDSEGAAS